MDNTQGAAPAIADNAASQPVATAQTTAPADWRSTLPDDLKSHKTLEKFTEVPALAGAYVNLERMLGWEKLPLPNTELDPNNPDWQQVYDRLGRPKSPEEYKFQPAQLPEGMPYDEALEGKFKVAAHMAGANNKQAEIFRDMFVAYQVEAANAARVAYAQEREAAEGQLQQELGQAYEPTVKAAKVALNKYGGAELVTFLESNGLGNHPALVKAFGQIGKELLGDTDLKDSGAGNFDTPADIEQQIKDYQARYHYALFDRSHPEFEARHREYDRLFDRLEAIQARR